MSAELTCQCDYEFADALTTYMYVFIISSPTSSCHPLRGAH